MHLKPSFLDASIAPLVTSSSRAVVFGLAVGLFGSVGALTPTAFAQTGTWEPTGSMTTPRIFFSATLLLDGKVLVSGGRMTRFGDPVASAELYDPNSGTWTLTGSMTTPRDLHSATLLPDGKVLVAGGFDSGFDPISSAEVYDPSGGTWMPTGSMRDPRGEHMATLITVSPLLGRVLVAGGVESPSLASAELYDPSTGTWSDTGSMETARYFPTPSYASSADGSVFVVGGWICCPYEGFSAPESYNPTTQLWIPMSDKTTAANGPAALLPSGQVLVAGGAVGTAFSHVKSVAGAELYDASTDTWVRTERMSVDRSSSSMTRLASGRVLMAGGSRDMPPNVCTLLSSAEVYGSNEGWHSAGNMATARELHQAVLLPGGRVLVVGGMNCAGTVLFDSAELYHPEP